MPRVEALVPIAEANARASGAAVADEMAHLLVLMVLMDLPNSPKTTVQEGLITLIPDAVAVAASWWPEDAERGPKE